MTTNSRQYEIRVVAIICLAFGLAIFEMNSSSYLMPFIQPDLRLSNAEVGVLSSAYFMAFALSSYLAGAVADRLGTFKKILQFTLLAFALGSVVSGFAHSFWALLAARLLMGFLEGPIQPVTQSIIVLESPPERSGTNMGISQNFGASILGFLAPLVLVYLGAHYTWRDGFFVVAFPALICTVLVARYLREPSAREAQLHDRGATPTAGPGGLADVLRCPNVWVCAVGFCAFLAYATITFGFLPLFLVKIRHFPPEQMGILMSVLGISGLVLGISLPIVSDRIGRKPVIIASGLVGTLVPLGALYFTGPFSVLALLVFVGWAPAGASSLINATIPCESVPARSISTAMGFIFGVSTVIGGVAGPTFAGWSADRWSLAMPMLILVGCSVVMTAAFLMVRETAPVKASGAKMIRSDPV